MHGLPPTLTLPREGGGDTTAGARGTKFVHFALGLNVANS